MRLLKIVDEFSVCKLSSVENVDLTEAYTFLSVTDDEISLVCRREYVPEEAVESEDGWRALKLSGVLDFSMIGLRSKISCLLAEHDIHTFAISTFNTDYILIKSAYFDNALGILTEHGYEVI